jgi:hypothetical protein
VILAALKEKGYTAPPSLFGMRDVALRADAQEGGSDAAKEESGAQV